MQYQKFPMRLSSPAIAVIAAALLVTACDDDDDNGFTGGNTEIRVVHAVADAPRVNVYLNDDEVLTNFDYRSGTGYIAVPQGSYDVRVEAIVPGGNVDVIDVSGVSFLRDRRTTIYASGDTSDGTIAPLVDKVFDFDAIAEAKAYFDRNAHVGKVVLRM